MQAVLRTFAKTVTKHPLKPLYYFNVGPRKSNLSYKNANETCESLPDKDHYHVSYIERNEVEARIMKILSYFEKIDLKGFKWTDDLEKDLKMDSLDQTVLLTSVEEEFNIVFEDRVFDNFTNLEQVVKFIASDSLAF